MPGTHLQAARIIDTVEVLGNRIKERFPAAGLNAVCEHLVTFARQAEQRSHEITRPMYGVRAISALLVIVLIGLFLGGVTLVRLPEQRLAASEFIQVLDAGFNALLLIGVALFFLTSLETRVKRDRALRAVHELRSLAHVIDMHQLTKDPERVLTPGRNTQSSPRHNMSRFQLSRYLDYCSEMLALAGKVGALYVDDFTDPEAVEAVNDLENLTSGMSRKIWQKINVLYSAGEADWDREPPSISAPTATASELPPEPPGTP